MTQPTDKHGRSCSCEGCVELTKGIEEIGKRAGITLTTPTDNAEWLDEIIDELLGDYPVNPPVKLANGDVWKSNTSNAEVISRAKQAILTHIDTVCREARESEIETAISMTRQYWDKKSPFTNFENINANTLASTSAYLLTRKAQLNPNKDTENE